MDIAHQTPLSMGLSQQKYWSELPFPLPGDLPNPGTEPTSLKSSALVGGFFFFFNHSCHLGSPLGILCSVTKLCPTLCDPMDYNPPGSFVLGVLQARILEWVAISSSRGSSQPRDRTLVSCVSCIAGGVFTALCCSLLSTSCAILTIAAKKSLQNLAF